MPHFTATCLYVLTVRDLFVIEVARRCVGMRSLMAQKWPNMHPVEQVVYQDDCAAARSQ